jgi:cell cycle related kinase
VLGTPTEEMWPGMTELPDFNKITFPDMPPIPLECIVPDASPDVRGFRLLLVFPDLLSGRH